MRAPRAAGVGATARSPAPMGAGRSRGGTDANPEEALMERPLPAWFDDAKLGIFVHWTAAAVPAYAPVTDSPFDLAAEGGWEEAMRCSPYVEWYQNSIAIEGSPAALHHAEVHGNRPYDDFVDDVPRRARRMAGGPVGRPLRGRRRPLRGAGHQAPRRRAAVAERHAQPAQAAVGGASATSSATSPRRCGPATCASAPTTRAASTGPSAGCRCATSRRCSGPSRRRRSTSPTPTPTGHELIDRYRPDVLWNDIGYPAAADLPALFERYYAAVPHGVVNNRFDWIGPDRRHGALRLRDARVLHQGQRDPEVGEHPRHRHELRLQPRGGRVVLPVARRAGADVRRRRRPRRQPAPQRRSQRRRHDPVGAGAAAPRARLVAPHERRRHLRDPSLDPHRRHDR